MASKMRPESLATIKCSNCAQEIPIMSLAEHVCASAAAAPPKKSALNFFARLAGTSNTTPAEPKSEPTASKSGRSTPPPMIDPAAANRPFLQPTQPTPMSNYGSSTYAKSPPPLTQDKFSPMSRRFGNADRNEFDMSLGYDNPYPPFSPNPYPESARLKSPGRGLMSPNPPRNPRLYGNDEPEAPLKSPVESVMQRANTLKSGPFGSRADMGYDGESRENPFSHRRNKTSESIKSFRNKAGQDIFRRPSISNSQNAKDSAYAEFSMSNPYGDTPPVPELPRAQPTSAPRRMRPTEQIDRFLEQLQSDGSYSSALPTTSPARSQPGPIPIPKVPTSNPYFDDPPLSTISPSTPPSMPTTLRNRSRTDARLNGAPPVPPVPGMQKQFSNPGSHSPTESASSGESLFSSNTSASSRSSPSNSDAGGWLRRPSDASARPAFERDQAAQARAGKDVVAPRPRPLDVGPPLPQGRQRSNGPPIFRKPSRDLKESDIMQDPAIQGGLFGSSRPRRPSNNAPPPSRSLTSAGASRRPPPMDDPVFKPPNRSRTDPVGAMAMRRTPTAATPRAPCRGCGEAIIGRAVKAADGRLSGRWHKHCFACTTCTTPFPSGDFYVMNDMPYCEQHYHQLNNSLCGDCGSGIEGQYLETDRGKKFHKGCFTCTTCNIPLRDEYMEVKGKQYCERHAWAVAQRNAGLDPNGGMGGRRGGAGGMFRAAGGLGKDISKRTTRMMYI